LHIHQRFSAISSFLRTKQDLEISRDRIMSES
jgi:hypothetical protein